MNIALQNGDVRQCNMYVFKDDGTFVIMVISIDNPGFLGMLTYFSLLFLWCLSSICITLQMHMIPITSLNV